MMRELMTIGILTLLVAATIWAATPAAPAKDSRVLDLATAHERFEAGDALFLDARSFEDYAAGHIPGAINIPVHDEGKLEMMVALEDMLRSAPVLVLYCTGPECDMSRLLAEDLEAFGIPAEQMRLFEGGMAQWQQAGYPVSTDTGFQESLQPSAD